MEDIKSKLAKLNQLLQDMGSAAVAFSAGVDSAFLLEAAHRMLGEKAVAVTACSSVFSGNEQVEAEEFCRARGIWQILIDVKPLELVPFRENHRDRCYHCKNMIFREILSVAQAEEIPYVIEGTNVDDLGDYRPGLKALEELGIRSPLREAGLTKAEIRELSRKWGLPTWNKPSFACLASRFVTGEEITEERLSMVREAEKLLAEEGFRQYRVRIHADLARIELTPEDIPCLIRTEERERLIRKMKQLGFRYISLDLEGYRTGSMNLESDVRKSQV